MQHPLVFAGARVCELGAGMAGLAGLAVAIQSTPKRVLITDGNEKSASALSAAVSEQAM